MAAIDIKDRATYGVSDASRYLRMNASTLRTWIGASGLIESPGNRYLSFNNLLEAHLLKALRRTHKFSMQSLRRTLPLAAKLLQTTRPLLNANFATDGISLFLDTDESLVNLSRESQIAIREMVSLYTERIVRNPHGVGITLFPFIRQPRAEEPRSISIDPRISFGRPVIAGTGVAAEVVAGRFAGGDTVAELASEYQLPAATIDDGIRWETYYAKAA